MELGDCVQTTATNSDRVCGSINRVNPDVFTIDVCQGVNTYANKTFWLSKNPSRVCCQPSHIIGKKSCRTERSQTTVRVARPIVIPDPCVDAVRTWGLPVSREVARIRFKRQDFVGKLLTIPTIERAIAFFLNHTILDWLRRCQDVLPLRGTTARDGNSPQVKNILHKLDEHSVVTPITNVNLNHTHDFATEAIPRRTQSEHVPRIQGSTTTSDRDAAADGCSGQRPKITFCYNRCQTLLPNTRIVYRGRNHSTKLLDLSKVVNRQRGRTTK